jgi:hypothetical protein
MLKEEDEVVQSRIEKLSNKNPFELMRNDMFGSCCIRNPQEYIS